MAVLRTDHLAPPATLREIFGKGSKSSRGSSQPNLQNAHRHCRRDVGRARVRFLHGEAAVNGGFA
jgi:hypothetical protein